MHDIDFRPAILYVGTEMQDDFKSFFDRIPGFFCPLLEVAYCRRAPAEPRATRKGSFLVSPLTNACFRNSSNFADHQNLDLKAAPKPRDESRKREKHKTRGLKEFSMSFGRQNHPESGVSKTPTKSGNSTQSWLTS